MTQKVNFRWNFLFDFRLFLPWWGWSLGRIELLDYAQNVKERKAGPGSKWECRRGGGRDGPIMG